MSNAAGSQKAAQFTESVIREMTRLAQRHDAVNLSQGFPDFSAPEVVKAAACTAISDDINQYAINSSIYVPSDAVDLYLPVEIDIGGPQYTREDAAFLDAVRMERPGDIDMDQAIHVQRIVDAVYTSSSANGAPEEVSA